MTTATGKKVRLREKQDGDVHEDYLWQRDPELSRLDGMKPTRLSFEEYQAAYPKQLRFARMTTRHIFALETLKGEHIGNIAYYNLDEDEMEAELGIMIGDRDYWDKGYGEDAVNTLLNHIFTETKLRRIYLKTLESNQRAQKCFKKAGFKPYTTMVQDGLSFVLMEIYRRDWEKAQQKTGGVKSERNL
ncbi:MAG: GNAT family N-acetyltransferase [Chloroflexota bacterium]